LSGANVVEKWKRVGRKCCAAANSNNPSKNRPDLSYRIIHGGVSFGQASSQINKEEKSGKYLGKGKMLILPR